MLAEPARMARVTRVVDRGGGHYEVSILIAAAGAGRCFGWQPLAKVSMMIMRPPQQRHGRGSTRGPSAAAVSNVLAGFERDGTASNSRARAMLGGAIAIGEQSVVADAVQALGQHVRQKAANELVGWQGHGLVPVRALDPVILPLERDAGLVG